MTLLTAGLLDLALCSLVMSLTWALARRVNNYGVVDAVWAFCFTATGLLFAALGEGRALRRVVMALLLAAWSLRLGWHLARRITAHHPEEDRRYAALRAEYGAHVPGRFFLFFQIQAISVAVLALPFWFAAQNPAPAFAALEWVGAGLLLLSLAGEATADRQLARFKADPGNHGLVCDVGLWRYSRHPNYFCESLVWWSFFIFTLGSRGGWTGVYAPLVMLLLLLKVTGVPPAEEQSLRSRGDRYRAYQARTNRFVPWFPKE